MWTEQILGVKAPMSSFIMTHNISICFFTFAGGILAAQSKLTINNAVSIPNTTAGLGGGTSMTLGGTINVLGTGTLALSNTGITTISGAITGSGVLATTGPLANLLLNPASNNTLGTYLTSGNILVGNAAAFWTADGYPGPGATLAVGMTMGYRAGRHAGRTVR